MNTPVDFVNVICELKNGRAAIDVSRKLSELVAAVAEHKKPGKLMLELRLEPSGTTDGRVTETSVSWQCRIAKPEGDTGRSLFFVTRDGSLSRTDPDQLDLYEPPQTQVVEEETQHGRE